MIFQDFSTGPCRLATRPNRLGLLLRRKRSGGASPPATVSVTLKMLMQVTMKEADITPEECRESGSAQRGGNTGGFRTPAELKNHIVEVVRLPHLLTEHYRIIVRPREGLNIKNGSEIKVDQALSLAVNLAPADITDDIFCSNVMQNIFVASTPTQKNARAKSRVESITVGVANYELWHRADVCSTPETTISRRCGIESPLEDHVCTPKFGLCGGLHPTADKQCKQRFQLPYVVRRRMERQRAKSPVSPDRKRDRSATFLLQKRTLPFQGAFAIEKTFPLQGATSHAHPDATRGWVEHQSASRIVQLARKNASLRNAFEQLKADIAELKRAGKALPPPRPLPPETEKVATPTEIEAATHLNREIAVESWRPCTAAGHDHGHGGLRAAFRTTG
ncbi:hypothetical protein HPB48_010844 [Haemaphysalis longicornis]|uniref:Uncharacterized protein n=1 Tax=Haemaphysalis longicornis TaxID=44386 RepID=A0A9J6GLD6_HAELO|nr:hypothetical protein HPB48_010844 [Haemaphysalis longicornis]